MGYLLLYLQPYPLNWIHVVSYWGHHDLGQCVLLEHIVGGGLGGDGVNVGAGLNGCGMFQAFALSWAKATTASWLSMFFFF
jgi:hypothetical protein